MNVLEQLCTCPTGLGVRVDDPDCYVHSTGGPDEDLIILHRRDGSRRLLYRGELERADMAKRIYARGTGRPTRYARIEITEEDEP